MQNRIVMDSFIDKVMEMIEDKLPAAIRGSLKQLYEQELDTGKINIKLVVTLEDKEVADPTITAVNATRTITVPKIDYTITRQVVLKEETKDSLDGTGYEVIFDSLGNPEIKRVPTAQTTIFDEDSAENWGVKTDSNGNGLRVLQAAVDAESDDNEEELDVDDFDADPHFDEEE